MTIVDEFRQHELRVLDRLVDGELSQADRRDLLAALDDEPGAWRRCALAFLESQAWRWQLGRMAAEPLVAHTAHAGSAAAGPSSRARSAARWTWTLAMAAGLFLAFGLGTRFSTSAPSIANVQPAPQPASASPTALVSGATATGPEDNSPVGADPEPTVAAAKAGKSSPWQTLTLAQADESGNVDPNSKFEVRVRDSADGEKIDLEKMLAGETSTLPAALVDQLEQEGWKVTRQRRLLPVALSDGRQMVVPVEQVDVHRPDSVQF
ncbi:MAG: hypothetical protein AB7O59_02320 [Pirellulales bacterium]